VLESVCMQSHFVLAIAASLCTSLNTSFVTTQHLTHSFISIHRLRKRRVPIGGQNRLCDCPCAAQMTATSAPNTLSSLHSSLHAHYSLSRTLSNKTYLRRVHIKISDAQRLFFAVPEFRSSAPLFTEELGAARYAPDKILARNSVSLLDGEGRLWPVQYECVLRGGQRHSRLKSGWTKLCRANHFGVGDRIQFQRHTLRDKSCVV